GRKYSTPAIVVITFKSKSVSLNNRIVLFPVYASILIVFACKFITSHTPSCHRERGTRAAIQDTLSFSDLIRESNEEQYRVRMAAGYALVMTSSSPIPI
ncbi:MAG: hypothetical protein LBR60_02800, partial [Fibrobacter sp.]|nr:hypothetical protein [Fibrobacter sp.]